MLVGVFEVLGVVCFVEGWIIGVGGVFFKDFFGVIGFEFCC